MKEELAVLQNVPQSLPEPLKESKLMGDGRELFVL